MCPHILRYLTTAVITNKRRKAVLKELVKVIQQETYTYKDPITEFLECLYVNFDFDGAQKKLSECETVSFISRFSKKNSETFISLDVSWVPNAIYIYVVAVYFLNFLL